MRILGISSMFHDAAVTVIQDGQIEFAGHAERYSKEKNDAFINPELMAEALRNGLPDVIVLHEKTWAKRARSLYAGNWSTFQEPTQEQWIREFYPELAEVPIKSYWHHETHAAAGVLTSDFQECAVMVIDAIGEFDTATIWHWIGGKLKKLHSIKFPHSLGLFYSAMTDFVGLKPMEDEYILMGMAAYGKPIYANELNKRLFKTSKGIKGKKNLQRGLPQEFLGRDLMTGTDEWGHTSMDYNLAASAQAVTEEKILEFARKAKQLTGSDNLVFMGGCALNCVANSNLFSVFEKVHIMPNPGDAGSSLGAAALHYYKQTGRKVEWTGPYLGREIAGKYPVNKALNSLLNGEIFGIANGKAEFGPRALGNRTLCADPRGSEIKDRMNEIKKRQKFRPFAPMILASHVHEYFEMPGGRELSPYMQYVAKCKKPDLFPAIVHADGTSRVQTVTQLDHPGLHRLLTRFYEATGCPMLVNTSLNIKGQPIVNDEADAAAFTKHYGITVHTKDD
jgi:carbamoyltransferase